jgi:hypothetical protein
MNEKIYRVLDEELRISGQTKAKLLQFSTSYIEMNKMWSLSSVSSK